MNEPMNECIGGYCVLHVLRLSKSSNLDLNRPSAASRPFIFRVCSVLSEVLEGIALDDGHKVVLKVLKPARSYKIKREIRVLQVKY